MPNKISITASFRGTAHEIGKLANQLARASNYQPSKFKKEDLEAAFELLLQPLSRNSSEEPLSLQQLHDATGINKSTLSEMRIGLIVMGLLPYEEDKFSTQHIRDIWSALNDPKNKDKYYFQIAAEHGWEETSVFYYARVGRFAGVVPSRDERRTRPLSDVAPVKAVFLGSTDMVEPELKPGDYKKITRMLINATDEDGHFEDRTITYIAKQLDISPNVVKEVRIGLVAMAQLPERQPINRELIRTMWDALESDKLTPIQEMAAQHRWDYQTLFRAGIMGRLVGEVTPRRLRKKKAMLPQVLKLMREKDYTAAAAARELDLDVATVRSWTKNIKGYTQQDKIQARMKRMLALIVKNPSLNNVELAKALNVSPNAVADYAVRLINQLEKSNKPADKTKLEIMKQRQSRPPAQSRKYLRGEPKP